MKRRKLIPRDMPVMPAQCRTCPFRPDGDKRLVAAILDRTLLQAQQICHHPGLDDKPPTHLCRGARDEQLTLLHRLGYIKEPTDKAFAETSSRVLAAVNAARDATEYGGN